MDVRRRTQIGSVSKSSKDPINIDNYLTIEALEDGLTAKLSKNVVEYCIDGDGDWKSLAVNTATESINSGQTLSFRGNLTPSYGIGTFTISKKCDLKGNIMSMLFGDNAANNYSLSGKNKAFFSLFHNCKTIINANNLSLPATTLANYCYQLMFYSCTSLTTAPELPATTLANGCYENMFSYCSSLTTAPELPATTLANDCYNCMFGECSSLTTAPELPATTLANYCYNMMFYGCRILNYIKMLATNISASGCLSSWVGGVSSTGTFIKNPDMTTLPTGDSGIPSGWTVINQITFTIKDTQTFQAEEGMTWEEFVNSDYNPGSFSMLSSAVYFKPDTSQWNLNVYDDNGTTPTYSYDKIINEHIYYIVEPGAGD